MLNKLDPKGTTPIPDALLFAPLDCESFRLLLVLMAHAEGHLDDQGYYPVSNGRLTATREELLEKLGTESTSRSLMKALHMLAAGEYISFKPSSCPDDELEIEVNFEGWLPGGIFEHLKKRIPKRVPQGIKKEIVRPI